jgi:hypothetical protein
VVAEEAEASDSMIKIMFLVKLPRVLETDREGWRMRRVHGVSFVQSGRNAPNTLAVSNVGSTAE